jgi:hypothetical protein
MNKTTSGAVRSKTIWLGGAVAVLGYVQANISLFAPWLDPKYIGLGNVLLGVAVIVVRFYTDSSLADKTEQ